jgi:squalene-hopene/tetraprenyl-beta-curcumene cyclase
MALRQASPRGQDPEADAAIERGLTWVLGMQSQNGGWASFDRDNDKEFLTKIPFADFNALIDPSTVDITSRVLEMFGIIAAEKFSLSHPVVQRAIKFIKKEQCADGSWYGRWGVNYLYGTWQVLRGLRLIGEDMTKPYVRRAVEWLQRVQLADGGWGERADTYEFPARKGMGPSTPSQTSWALMGLLAAGEGDGDSVQRGIFYLLSRQRPDGTWDEEEWTGTGFPRVFYMKYHYYRHYWPLLSLLQFQRYVRGFRP